MDAAGGSASSRPRSSALCGIRAGLRQRGNRLFFTLTQPLASPPRENAQPTGTDWATFFRPCRGWSEFSEIFFVPCNLAGLKSRVWPFVPRSGTQEIAFRSPPLKRRATPSRPAGAGLWRCCASILSHPNLLAVTASTGVKTLHCYVSVFGIASLVGRMIEANPSLPPRNRLLSQ
jgi:hypothetical protein